MVVASLLENATLSILRESKSIVTIFVDLLPSFFKIQNQVIKEKKKKTPATDSYKIIDKSLLKPVSLCPSPDSVCLSSWCIGGPRLAVNEPMRK